MIEIKRSITIGDIENLHSRLEKISEQKLSLKLPLELETPGFGVVAALIQFACTWIRSAKNDKLVVALQNDDERLSDWARQDFAFPIIIMSWRYGIISEYSGQDLRPFLRPYTQKINLDMRSLSQVRGNQLLLTCFDHLPSKSGLLNSFYIDGKFVDQEDILEFTLMPAILKALNFNKTLFKNHLRQIMDDLRGMIYELMKNTDEWARTDKNNGILNPNVRGLYIRMIRRSVHSIGEQYQNEAAFKNFFDGLNPTEGHLLFMELSIFDSGPGFIDRFAPTRNNNLPNEKIDILRQCLIRRSTSAKGLVAGGKGFGLDRILDILSTQGFIMIRTDTLAVYRNMKDYPHLKEPDYNNVALFDWENRSSHTFISRPKASGSVLSIIYPLNGI